MHGSHAPIEPGGLSTSSLHSNTAEEPPLEVKVKVAEAALVMLAGGPDVMKVFGGAGVAVGVGVRVAVGV